MTDTEPRWSCEFLPLAAGRGPWSPTRCRLTEPCPLTLATNNLLPSGDTTKAPGYQPVGIRPARELAAGRPGAAASDAFAPSRTTATQLLVPLAAYSVAPSGLSARAFTPLPKGRRASGRQEIVSVTSWVVVSMADTVSLLALAT